MSVRNQTQTYIVGIDEVGRGPLAGPVMVGAALVPTNFEWTLLPGVGDSKQVSKRRRDVIFELARQLKREGRIDYEVVAVSAKRIDRIGIVPAIREALAKALAGVTNRTGLVQPQAFCIKLDGGLYAPKEYLHQETIIKGDVTEKVIGLASIIAKVTRDTYMEQLGKKVQFARYDFATHKGYGTKQHRAAIAEVGLSVQHRASFCRNIHPKT